MKLKELSLQDCEQARIWRNECLESLRTPFPLTKEMQEQFYKDVVCNRGSHARYWGIWETEKATLKIPLEGGYLGTPVDSSTLLPESYDAHIFIGMVGLENIEWENRRAEISIIINPEYKGKGYGTEAVGLLLEQGFMYLNLENIWGECYKSNKA
ncbi:MAG: GNAT family N-acetyltransferase, partial [Candidatus Bipolaricaulis sp.]|nr:GNAT family N-acetyltransferase [Candidatus Bipolaricaulis sp.]